MKNCVKCGTDKPKIWACAEPPICDPCYQAEWRQDHREEHKKYMKEYNAKHRVPRATLSLEERLVLRQKDKILNRLTCNRFKVAKRHAIRRGYTWNLTKIEYEEFLNKPCYYCGGPTPETCSGLDRIDNEKDYELGNVRPCCQLCNQMKSTLSENEFYLHMKIILQHLNLI